MDQATATTIPPGQFEAVFHIGYAAAVQTATDLFQGARAPEEWTAAARNILTDDELAELALTAWTILARRDQAVA